MDFGDKSSGFADLKNTVDRGSAESFGPVSGFCQSRSSDCGSDHQFSVGLGQCAGVLSANVSGRDFLVNRRIYMCSSIDSDGNDVRQPCAWFNAASIPVSGEVWRSYANTCGRFYIWFIHELI